MSTDTTITTPEEAAPAGGGVAVTEITTPEPAAPPVEPSPPVADAPPEEEDVLAKVAEHFKDEDPSAVVRAVTAEDVEALDGKARGVVRALVARMLAGDEKQKAAHAAQMAEIEKAQAAIKAQADDLRRKTAGLYALATSPELEAARRGEKPKVDPLSPEGIEQLAQHHALQGVLKALDPIYRDQAAAARELHTADVAAKFPVIKTEEKAFLAFMQDMNKGVDPAAVKAGKAAWRVDLELGAELFAAKHEAAQAKAAAEQRRAAEVSDRSRAAAAINRTAAATTAVPDLAIPKEVYDRNEVSAYLARQTPERRAALIAHARSQPARA